MPKISLLIADVDGTLVTENKVLTKRAQSAVAALDAHGIRFAITSGGPPRGMAMLIEPLALSSPIAGFNGGVFTHPRPSPLHDLVKGALYGGERRKPLDQAVRSRRSTESRLLRRHNGASLGHLIERRIGRRPAFILKIPAQRGRWSMDTAL
jgi:hypothetical protein